MHGSTEGCLGIEYGLYFIGIPKKLRGGSLFHLHLLHTKSCKSILIKKKFIEIYEVEFFSCTGKSGVQPS